MLSSEDILTTVSMLQNEHLDVRAVTLGIDPFSCADRDPETLCRLAREKVLQPRRGIQEACQRAVERYGIPIVNRRIALSPVAPLVAEHEPETLLRFARMLDAVAEEAGVDFIGGWTAHVQKGMTLASRALIDSLPDVSLGDDPPLRVGERCLVARRDQYGCPLTPGAQDPRDGRAHRRPRRLCLLQAGHLCQPAGG